MKKFFKRFFLFLLVVFVGVQFFRPAKNRSEGMSAYDITTKYAIPQDVLASLKIACYDCHSNNTRYPWYNNIQPVYWWMNNHIEEGKDHLNFFTFGDYGLKKGEKKMKGIAKVIEKSIMPISSYTLIHRDAILNDHQALMIENWAKNAKLTGVKNP